jgi:Flp pilus assembly protein TadG
MRRLTLRARMGEERGAVGVMVALLLGPLLGFAAIAVDLSAVYSERAQLRNGTDAAALAVATDCAWKADCGDELATASSLVTKNSGQVGATLSTPTVAVNTTTQQVTVTARAQQKHWFAPVLGRSASTVSGTSVAAWAGISRATADIPIAISKCQFDKMQRGTVITLYPSEAGTCGTGTAAVPALIWLNTDASACKTSDLAVGATLSRYLPTSRSDMPAKCRPSGFGSFPLSSVVDKQVHIPVFEQASATAAPKVYGFVAFDVDEFKLGERSFKITNLWELIIFIIQWWFNRVPEDQGYRAIGSLGTSVVLSDAPSQTSAPDLGARSVFLTEQR